MTALWAEVITVTQTGSGEDGTLRWAIKQANRNPGPDVIQFDLAPSLKDSDTGTFLFKGEDLDGSPLPLPEITDTIEINGLSQDGSILGDDGMPRTLLIELTRNPLKFRTGSDGSKVLGLVMNDSADSAISIQRSGYHTIAYNFIGTDSTGTSARGTMKNGVHADPAFCNLIRNNLISGNLDFGLNLNEHGPQRGRNIIRNNRIGTDITGSKPVGDFKFVGMYTWTGDNIIEDNVFAFIGRDTGGRGIALDNRWNNSSFNRIRGNRIFNNGGAGVHIFGSSKGNLITDNAIFNNGPRDTGSDINYKFAGVLIEGPDAHSNVLLRNTIFGNGGLSIDMKTQGPSFRNQTKKAFEKGAIMTAPVLHPSQSKAQSDGVLVSGSLNSVPNQDFAIEVYGGRADPHRCVLLPKPVAFLDGVVHMKNVSIGEKLEWQTFTPDVAKEAIDNPGARDTYNGESRTLVFGSGNFPELSSSFPITEQGPEDQRDYFASSLSGAFRIAADANANGTTGETLQFTFKLYSDDQSRFTLKGGATFQVEDGESTETVGSVHHRSDSLLGNHSNPSSHTIMLKEGERYEFEGYHSEAYGNEVFEVTVALGDVRESGEGLLPIAQEELLQSYHHDSPICGEYAFNVGQPEHYLGTITVKTDSDGNATIKEKLHAKTDGISSLMATATMFQNGAPVQTSEVSEAVPLTSK